MKAQLDLVRAAVVEAGRCMHSMVVDNVETKSRANFVTNVDVAIQQMLHEKLQVIMPEARYLMEENDVMPDDLNGWVFVLDPVDGTTNLMYRYPMSAISLGLAKDGTVMHGWVYHPHTGELFEAHRGEGATCNGRPVAVTGATALPDALLIFGTSPYKRELTDKTFDVLRRFYDNCRDIRRSGCASLDLCAVASGRADIFFEWDLRPWDFAAGLLILEEAGAVIADMDGKPLDLLRGGPVLAATRELFPLAMQIFDTK